MSDSDIGDLELSKLTNKTSSSNTMYTQYELEEGKSSPSPSSSSTSSLNYITNSTSNLKKNLKLNLIFKKFKFSIGLILGFLIGLVIFNQIIISNNSNNSNNNLKFFTNSKKIHPDDVRKDSINLYFKLYKQTERYKENIAFQDSNPFDHMVTYNRLINSFKYIKDEDYDGIIEKNVIQMWLDEKQDRKNFIPDEELEINSDDNSNGVDRKKMVNPLIESNKIQNERKKEKEEKEKMDKFMKKLNGGPWGKPKGKDTVKAKLKEKGDNRAEGFNKRDGKNDDIDEDSVDFGAVKDRKSRKILTDDYPYRDMRQTWIDKNPGYKHLMFSYLQVYDVLKKNFENTVPEIYDAFDMLPHVILKSDFGRYLLVYLFGGMYADIDTKCQKPIDEWFDNFDKFKYKIGFVASLESDINEIEWNRYMPRRVELLQWAFKSKKNHHLIAYLISKIVETTYKAKYDNKLVAWSDQYVDVDKCSGVNIVDWTGPGEFTDSFIEYVNLMGDIDITDVDSDKSYAVHPGDKIFGPKIPIKLVNDYTKNKGWLYSWYGLIRLQTPRVINDLLVLPYSFRGSDPCDEDRPYCYLSHAFSGGWKDKDAS
ncbi:hypothetical protein B5S32_g3223 [[Candida] boidinii]|nr:hypothetical protein B5S32_g3223 [[Candida] boidinii]